MTKLLLKFKNKKLNYYYFKLKDYKFSFKLITIISIITFILSLFIISLCLSASATTNYTKIDVEKTFELHEKRNKEKIIISLYDSINNTTELLIEEVDDYMRGVNPRTKMSADFIVEQCLYNDFDIPLLLSQAHHETHFGKRTRSNSCFGIIRRRYKSVNASVPDYIKLIQTRYIINRTVDECLDAGFNVEGKKITYATNPKYAQTIKDTRSIIIKRTDINKYVDKIQKFNNSITKLEKEYYLKYNT